MGLSRAGWGVAVKVAAPGTGQTVTPRQALACARRWPEAALLVDVDLARRWGASALRTLQRRLPAGLLLVWPRADAQWVDLVLRAQLRGAVEAEATAEHLGEALRTLRQGGMWFPRRFMQWLVEAVVMRSADIPDPPSADGDVLPGGSRDSSDELTPRERAAFDLMRGGLSNKEIALRLDISVNTVKKHLQAALAKAGLRRRRQALALES